MPTFKISGNGSTTNSKTGKTFRWRHDQPVFVSESDLAGLKHIRPRMSELKPVIVPVEPMLQRESLSDITAKRKAGRPKKTEG